MPQFLTDPSDLDPKGARAVLRGEEARHLLLVLRGRPGQSVAVFDGRGRRWTGRLLNGEPGTAHLELLGPLPSNESPVEIELIQSIPKGESWEWILEKGTELGVARFQPVFSERSVPRFSPSRLGEKRRRWEKRVLSAAKQCERGTIPAVAEPLPLAAHLGSIRGGDEGEMRLCLSERFPGADPIPPGGSCARVRLAVGPEGGWAPTEGAALLAAGFRAVTLGPRILRTETAVVAGLALVQRRWGDLEGRGSPC